MNDGKLNGWILQGFNVLNSLPNKNKTVAGMSKLKFLIVMDPLQTESSEFWKNFGESNNVNPADIQTGSIPFTNYLFRRRRWLYCQLWSLGTMALEGCDQPGEALPDVEILSMIREEMHHLYQEDLKKVFNQRFRIFRSDDLELCTTACTKLSRISKKN